MREEIIQCPNQFNTAIRQDIMEKHKENPGIKIVPMCHK